MSTYVYLFEIDKLNNRLQWNGEQPSTKFLWMTKMRRRFRHDSVISGSSAVTPGVKGHGGVKRAEWPQRTWNWW